MEFNTHLINFHTKILDNRSKNSSNTQPNLMHVPMLNYYKYDEKLKSSSH
jgi:hypothetical protein